MIIAYNPNEPLWLSLSASYKSAQMLNKNVDKHDNFIDVLFLNKYSIQTESVAMFKKNKIVFASKWN